jgi:membrane protease YdiL (CAAX protease family)
MATAASPSNPLARTARDYWRQSRRPLASLLFILPLLAVYEGGVLWLGPDAVRNGADVWLSQLLTPLGQSGIVLVPLSAVLILLAWHHLSGQQWRVSAIVLYTMLGECVVLALLLVGLAHAQAGVMALCGVPAPAAASSADDRPCLETTGVPGAACLHLPDSRDDKGGQAAHGTRIPSFQIERNLPACSWQSLPLVRSFIGQLVRFFGAGIYEELLFRLMLLPMVAAMLGILIGSPRVKIFCAVVLTSLAFSAAHYIGPHGEQLLAYTFTFRFLAGLVFALLFVHRGFGIAAGTHALYDIFVGFVFP